MRRLKVTLGSLLLSAALIPSLAGAGCAVRGEARVRYYDSDHRDWHNWDEHEERQYRRYLNERHMEYRDFNQMDNQGKAQYWKWRHSQAGSGS